MKGDYSITGLRIIYPQNKTTNYADACKETFRYVSRARAYHVFIITNHQSFTLNPIKLRLITSQINIFLP